MSWGDFKRSVGLNNLGTRKVTAKVAKVLPPAALLVPTKESLAAGAQALQTYGGVAKAATSGDAKGALKAARGAAKFAKSADKNTSAPPRLGSISLPTLTANVPAQPYAGQTVGGLTNPMDASDSLSLAQAQGDAEGALDNKLIIVSVIGLLGLFLFARAVK